MEIEYLNRNVGIIKMPERIFITHREENHIFRIFNGLGVSFDILKKLINIDCQKIIMLLHKSNGETEKFEVTPNLFIEKGFIWKDKAADYQRILPFGMLRKQKQTKLK